MATAEQPKKRVYPRTMREMIEANRDFNGLVKTLWFQLAGIFLLCFVQVMFSAYNRDVQSISFWLPILMMSILFPCLIHITINFSARIAKLEAALETRTMGDGKIVNSAESVPQQV